MKENKILTELPKRGKGQINYQAMVNMRLDLLFKGEKYTVVINEYINEKYPKFKINYKDKISEVQCYEFVHNCRFGEILKIRTKDFKIEIGAMFKNDKRDISIIEKEYRKDNKGTTRKWYKYKCNKCKHSNGESYEGWVVESNLLNGQGCACCSNKITIVDINSIWTTDRKFCEKYKISEEDAKTHTRGSNDRITVICPQCGRQKETRIAGLYRNGLSCTCGDGFSYPEKFMMSVLDQLNIEYETQYQPKYLNRLEDDGKYSQKKSDFYLPKYNLIIETDGGLNHKGGKSHSKSKKSLEYYIEVDKWKDKQHSLHGLKTIRIDCFKSDMEYIKNELLNSELNKIFNLSKVDWLKCEEFTLKNLIKEVCEYWNNKKVEESVTSLMKYFKLSQPTIIEYIKKGTTLGWCNYDPKEEMRRGSKSVSRKLVIFKDGEIVSAYVENKHRVIFNSTMELKRISSNEEVFGVKFGNGRISEVCTGKRETYKGYKFKYIEENELNYYIEMENKLNKNS